MIQDRHVALLTTTLDVSGAEKVIALLADGLAEAGYRVSVVGLQRRSGALSRLVGPHVEVIDLGLSGTFDIGVVDRLRRFLVREDVSILYTFLYHAHIVGRSAGRLAAVPHVISSQQVANWGGWWRQTLEKWSSRWCERIIAVSDGVKADVVGRMGFSAERVEVIFNAIPVATYSPSTQPFGRSGQAIVLGSVSRLAPEKNHDSLIRGFALARQTIPQLHLRLAGTGPLASRLAGVVREQDLTQCVELVGHVEDVRGFLDGLDLYVQPSRTEGLPCAVLEAMAMKRPIVATDVPGNQDAIVPGVTGWLIAPNSPTAWADAIAEAVRDRPRAIALGEAGRRRAEALFDSDAMVRKTLRLLNELEGLPCP